MCEQDLNGINLNNFSPVSDKSNLITLKDIIERRKGRAFMVQNALQIALQTDFGPQIYVQNGQLDDNSTIIIYEEMHFKTNDIGILIFPPDNLTNDLENEILKALDDLPKGNSALLVTESKYSYLVEKYFGQRQIPFKKVPHFEFSFSGKNPDVKNSQHDPNLRSMRPDDLEFLTNHWNYAKSDGGSGNYLSKCIQTLPSAAISVPNDQGVSEIVCCATTYNLGYAGMLVTDPGQRGKGHAPKVMKYLEKEMKEMGLVPSCGVQTDNVSSIRVMGKIGWENTNSFDSFFCNFINIDNYEMIH